MDTPLWEPMVEALGDIILRTPKPFLDGKMEFLDTIRTG